MTDTDPPDTTRGLRRRLESAAIRGDALIGAARAKHHAARMPRRIDAYRGWGDADGLEVSGRVLAESAPIDPADADSAWDNLTATWRRFDSDEVPGARVTVQLGARRVDATCDDGGYYTAALPGPRDVDAPWIEVDTRLADGTLAIAQPVRLVHADARIGVISDIDDTVLESGITNWKTAAHLTFLHNARTRKPLKGVAALYRALQSGTDGRGLAPIFYVSSSPWNLYDLLDRFMALNDIPRGPLLLRDFGLAPGKFIAPRGHGEKLERARMLIRRFPRLRWVLLGDSGQADADLYAQAANEFGDRIAAIYIRDVDPDIASPLDVAVGAQIERVGPSKVPMILARDSRAIAEHAAGLGLIAADAVIEVAKSVERDAARPTLAAAAIQAAATGDANGPVG